MVGNRQGDLDFKVGLIRISLTDLFFIHLPAKCVQMRFFARQDLGMKSIHFKTLLYLTLALTALVYLLGMFIDIMQVDAAQYAFISWEMTDTGEFLQVKYRGDDYLDKPPLLFWTSALSYQIFGVNNFAYKLPSVISMILAAWAVYRLGCLLHNKQTGILAAVMLATCTSTFIINQDCKTDNLLIGGVSMATYQLVAYLQNRRWLNIFGLGICLSWALLAKGPIGLIVPMSAFFGYFISKRDWKIIFDWKWIPSLLVIGILLTPMTIGLWKQFGSEGPRFYYWTQSFGRITGESEWQNDTDPFFFIHTFIWAFFPYVLLFVPALFSSVKQLIRSRGKIDTGTMLELAGFLLPFAALSLSKFKLPHYIFVVIPFAALISAQFFIRSTKQLQWTKIITWIIGVVGILGICIINAFVFPTLNPLSWASLLIVIVGLYFAHIQPSSESRFLGIGIGMCGIFLTMNTNFYPTLLTYQSQNRVGKYLLAKQIPKDNIFHLRYAGNALYHYGQNPTRPMYSATDVRRNMESRDTLWVYTRVDYLDRIAEVKDFKCDTIMKQPDFRVALLSIPFLNPKTRESHTKDTYLLKYYR